MPWSYQSRGDETVWQNFFSTRPPLLHPLFSIQKAIMAKGTKRASPGAEAEKNPLQDVELSDEDAKKLQQLQHDIARAELVLGQLIRPSILLL